MERAIARVEWVRPPRQARSQENLERILDAAEEVLAEKGFEQATIAEIVRRAQTSVGAFYSRFREKDALLGCLHDRFCDEAVATTRAVLGVNRWEGASAAEILGETVPFLIEVFRQRRGLIRAFVLRSSGDQAFADRWAQLSQLIAAELTSLLLARRDELRHPEPRLAIETGLQILLSTLDQLTLFDSIRRTGAKLDSKELPDEMLRLLVGYLGCEPSSTDFLRE